MSSFWSSMDGVRGGGPSSPSWFVACSYFPELLLSYFLSFFSRNCSLLANAFYFLLSQCCSPLLTILYCSHTAVLMRPNVITSIVTIAIAAIATMVIFVISHFRKLTIARSAGSQRAVHVHMGRVHHHLSQRRPRRR